MRETGREIDPRETWTLSRKAKTTTGFQRLTPPPWPRPLKGGGACHEVPSVAEPRPREISRVISRVISRLKIISFFFCLAFSFSIMVHADDNKWDDSNSIIRALLPNDYFVNLIMISLFWNQSQVIESLYELCNSCEPELCLGKPKTRLKNRNGWKRSKKENPKWKENEERNRWLMAAAAGARRSRSAVRATANLIPISHEKHR